jgi:uncharacterized protein (DUF302 family)
MLEPLSFQLELGDPPHVAEERVTQALRAEGFGVLTRVGIKATMKEKLGKDFRPYVILGACHPPMAHRALAEIPEIGLLLPCNVVVEARGTGSLVSIINPEVMIRVGDLAAGAAVCDVASEVRARLERATEALKG